MFYIYIYSFVRVLFFLTEAESNMNDLVSEYQQYQVATAEDEGMRRALKRIVRPKSLKPK